MQDTVTLGKLIRKINRKQHRMATMPMTLWRRGVVVKALDVSTKLIYVGPD